MPDAGSAQLRAIAAACRVAGDRGILNATRATLRVEAKTIINAAQKAAMERLPKSGGLNEQVASQRWTVSALTGPRTAGVRLRTKSPATQQTNAGFVRHPTFGHRGKGEWKTQQLPQAKGWASDTFEEHGPAVATAMIVVLNRTVAEIAAAAGGTV